MRVTLKEVSKSVILIGTLISGVLSHAITEIEGLISLFDFEIKKTLSFQSFRFEER